MYRETSEKHHWVNIIVYLWRWCGIGRQTDGLGGGTRRAVCSFLKMRVEGEIALWECGIASQESSHLGPSSDRELLFDLEELLSPSLASVAA